MLENEDKSRRSELFRTIKFIFAQSKIQNPKSMKTHFTILAMCGVVFFSCKTKQAIEAPMMEAEGTEEAVQADFLARGNEPFWNLQIDFDQNMRFQAINEPTELTMPLPQAQRKENDVLSYNISTAEGALQVTIVREDCQDSMSGEQFSHSVEVAAKDSKMEDFVRLSGCGSFQGKYRLNDTWVLTSLNGKAIDAASFPREVPSLGLQLVTGKVSGFAGCNRFNGAMTFDDTTITFDALAATKMACPKLEIENELMRALSMQTLTYELADAELTLRNDAHTLTLSRAE